jgi:hypothetical protein
VELYEQIKDLAPEVYQIGDCLAPRTLEEATYEGMMISLKLGIQNSPLQKDENTSIAK